MPAMPGSALVVIETKLVLRSLKAVLDRPPMTFDRHQRFDGCRRWASGGEEGEIAIGDTTTDQQTSGPELRTQTRTRVSAAARTFLHNQDPKATCRARPRIPSGLATARIGARDQVNVLQRDVTVLDDLERNLVLDLLDAKTGRRLVLDDEALIDENRFSYGLDKLCEWRGLPGKDETLLREAATAAGFKISKSPPREDPAAIASRAKFALSK